MVLAEALQCWKIGNEIVLRLRVEIHDLTHLRGIELQRTILSFKNETHQLANELHLQRKCTPFSISRYSTGVPVPN